MSSVAFLTPTYGPDLDRFRLLRRSMNALGITMAHYAVVGPEDLDLLTDLRKEPSLTIVSTTDILPPAIEKRRRAAQYGRRHLRHWARGGPIAGWYAQQLVKLAAAQVLDHDVFAVIDSDLVMMQPVAPSHFLSDDGRPLMFVDDDDQAFSGMADWNRKAAAFLGVDPAVVRQRQYIHAPQVLARAVVRELTASVENRSGREWCAAFADAEAYEYSTYGAWVDGGHAPNVQPAPPLRTRYFSVHEDMLDFRSAVTEIIAEGQTQFVCVQSRLHFPTSSYSDIVADAWRRTDLRG